MAVVQWLEQGPWFRFPATTSFTFSLLIFWRVNWKFKCVMFVLQLFSDQEQKILRKWLSKPEWSTNEPMRWWIASLWPQYIPRLYINHYSLLYYLPSSVLCMDIYLALPPPSFFSLYASFSPFLLLSPSYPLPSTFSHTLHPPTYAHTSLTQSKRCKWITLIILILIVITIIVVTSEFVIIIT